jgi:hypothetical protein
MAFSEMRLWEALRVERKMPGLWDYGTRLMCKLWEIGRGIYAATGVDLQDPGMSERWEGLLFQLRSEA